MECPSSIPGVDYRAFSRRVHESIIRDRIPVSGSIDLTSRCNLRCVHCYVKDAEPHGMSYQEVTGILDQVVDAGCLWMLLTGGEPLLRPDFRDIYLYAQKKGLLINLFTNGTLLDREMAAFLAEWPPFSVEISLYGATRETYERVTGVPGSFESCLRAIDLLQQQGLPLRLKSMILTLNHQELQQMMSFAEQLGVDFRYDGNIHGRVDGSLVTHEHRLPPEEIVKLDLADRRRVVALQELVDYSAGLKLNHQQLYHCGAGLDSFHVNAEGRLSLCILVREPGFDLTRGSFAEAWRSLIPQARFQTADENFKCSSCELYFLCGQCPGWSMLENQNSARKSEYLCRLAHLRSRAFVDQIEWRSGDDPHRDSAA